MILKGYVKSHSKSFVKSYLYYSKFGLVTIWYVGLVFGVQFWEVPGMGSFCTTGASCEAIPTAGYITTANLRFYQASVKLDVKQY